VRAVRNSNPKRAETDFEAICSMKRCQDVRFVPIVLKNSTVEAEGDR
jgi:hypothetical protein